MTDRHGEIDFPGHVTLVDLVEAHNTDPTRESEVRRDFVRQWGEIQELYYSRPEIGAAVALTAGTRKEAPRVHSVLGPIERDMDAIVLLLDDAYHLEIEVRSNLSGREQNADRNTVLHMIWVACNNALALLDNTADWSEQERRLARSETSKQFENPKRLLESTAEYYRRVAQRWAQVFYFRGMMFSAALVLATGIVLALVALQLSPSSGRDFFIAVGTFAAGSVGAVVSVMSRMTFGGLELDHTVGARQLFRLGLFRPLIGAAFGMAVLALVRGEVVPVRPPDSSDVEVYFYPGLAFLAGFSERYAQDMFSTAPGRPKAESDSSSAPSTGGSGA